MPRKKRVKQRFYEHPTAGPLLLIPHPRLPGRVAAYLGGVAVYETDAISAVGKTTLMGVGVDDHDEPEPEQED